MIDKNLLLSRYVNELHPHIRYRMNNPKKVNVRKVQLSVKVLLKFSKDNCEE